jgi:DNA repair exonuclease SbcCD nuclease subunit
MRGDSIPFHNLYRKFYEEVFFPYLKENNIDTIFQMGDLFDRRKFIGFQTLALSRKYFFQPAQEYKLHVLIGNHDIAFKNTLEVNSPQLLLNEYNNITVYDKPITVSFGGTVVDIIPWICNDNEIEINEFIKNSKSQICFGHFELAGFEMDRGNICHEGMDRNLLNKYDVVLSGHFHHKSTDGTITYVGTPGEMTWADYNDKRGFHIFDTETRELDFIENPHRMFHKIVYDDKLETLDSITEKDFSLYTNSMVKVIVANKINPVLYDMFLDGLYKASPLDISIVEDHTDYSEISDEDIVDQSDDTITILDKVIETLEIDLDKVKLKNVMHDIYFEAQNLEIA